MSDARGRGRPRPAVRPPLHPAGVCTRRRGTGHAALAAVAAVSLAGASPAEGGDWPQVLGPDRDGSVPTRGLSFGWEGRPEIIWSKKVGEGWAGPAIVGKRLILFHRADDRERVEALAADTGETLWAYAYPTDFVAKLSSDEGPRATPTVADGRVYTYGAAGMLHCLTLKTGEVQWRVDTRETFGSRRGFFGRAVSPLVVGKRVVVPVGGPEAGIVAFSTDNGDVLWRATKQKAAYASPVSATLGGERQVLVVMRQAFFGIDPKDGSIRFRYPWRTPVRASVRAAVPVVVGRRVFLSACYRTGAELVEWRDGELKKVWGSSDRLSNHYATSIHHAGYLYGFHGRQEYGPELRCIRLKTGAVQWSRKDLGAGNLLRVGNRLVILTERGELLVAPADPDGFEPAKRAQLLGKPLRAYPAIARGHLYARDSRKLICVELDP